MKQTMGKQQFVNEFLDVRPESFSRKSLEMIFEYFEEIEDATGEQLEFDPIAVCVEWCEYDITDLPDAYAYKYGDDCKGWTMGEWVTALNEQTMVLAIDDETLVLVML